MVDMEPDVRKPIQTKWASGLVQGDPREERAVILGEDTLPFAERKVTIGPDGIALRDFFLQRLGCTFVEADKSRDPDLFLIFAHGDFETLGGFCIGTTSSSSQGILSIEMIAEFHTSYSDVPVILFMTSCYSGH